MSFWYVPRSDGPEMGHSCQHCIHHRNCFWKCPARCIAAISRRNVRVSFSNEQTSPWPVGTVPLPAVNIYAHNLRRRSGDTLWRPYLISLKTRQTMTFELRMASTSFHSLSPILTSPGYIRITEDAIMFQKLPNGSWFQMFFAVHDGIMKHLIDDSVTINLRDDMLHTSSSSLAAASWSLAVSERRCWTASAHIASNSRISGEHAPWFSGVFGKRTVPCSALVQWVMPPSWQEKSSSVSEESITVVAR